MFRAADRRAAPTLRCGDLSAQVPYSAKPSSMRVGTLPSWRRQGRSPRRCGAWNHHPEARSRWGREGHRGGAGYLLDCAPRQSAVAPAGRGEGPRDPTVAARESPRTGAAHCTLPTLRWPPVVRNGPQVGPVILGEYPVDCVACEASGSRWPARGPSGALVDWKCGGPIRLGLSPVRAFARPPRSSARTTPSGRRRTRASPRRGSVLRRRTCHWLTPMKTSGLVSSAAFTEPPSRMPAATEHDDGLFVPGADRRFGDGGIADLHGCARWGEAQAAGARWMSCCIMWNGRSSTRPSGALPGSQRAKGTIRLSRTPNTASLSR
jgi:hypothetical protein